MADAIINNSTVGATQTVSGASCAPVRLANSNQSGDPMLPRFSAEFAPEGGPGSGNGAITFGSGGYAAGVTSETLGGSPGGVSLGKTYSYGYGVWFSTTGSTGRLFGLGSVPTNSPASGGVTFDRTLSLAAGKLQFSAAGAATATTTHTWNDGAWHYAYVSLTSQSVSIILLGVSTTTKVTIYVDGGADGSSTNGGLLGSPLATPAGYWYLGPTFTGSLSNFMVYNGTSSPTSPPPAPYSGATELWPLNDDGVTTYAGSLPSAIATPCAKVNISLTFTNPADTSISNMPLSTFADGSARILAAPATGQTQGLTIATSKGTGYSSDIAGLRLYVPITFSYHAGSSPGWAQTLVWSGDPADVFIA
ncbi:hypothetical protein [Nocardioides terrisoli]|uniref:hypothetical protein n=1 Tax=Nocardioides terrisoli TaxID=3388267 RepID=UPI00287BAC0E|nr:hypothetical protein [Nocardioides marmorisolisilvae]